MLNIYIYAWAWNEPITAWIQKAFFPFKLMHLFSFVFLFFFRFQIISVERLGSSD